MKSGYKTTEFWVALLSVAGPILAMFAGLDLTDTQELAAQIVAGITAVSYIMGRSYLKKT